MPIDENLINKNLDSNLLPISEDPNVNKLLQEQYKDLPMAPESSESQFGEGLDKVYGYRDELTSEVMKAFDAGLIDEMQLGSITQDQINELKAQDQSGLTNIFYRAPLRTGAKFAQSLLNTIGTLGGGAGWLIGSRDKEDLSMVFDNAFNKGVDDFFNEWVYENESAGLKVFTPKKVKEGSLWENMKSSSFWASEGADAVGFFTSMLVPGAAIKGLGIGAKAMMGINKISKPISKFINAGSKVGNTVDDVLAAGINTIAESGMEASGAYKHIKEQLIQEGYDENEANLIAADKAASVFNANMAILMGPNLLMNKYLFGKFKSGSKLMSDVVKQGGKKATSKALGKEILKTAPIGVISEGLEEGSQTATEKYFTDLALSGDKDEEGFVNEVNSMIEDTKGVWDTFLEELPDNVDMHKAMFLGGFLGGLGGGIGGLRKYKSVQNEYYGKKEGGKLNKYLNKTKFGKVIAGDGASRRGIKEIMAETMITNNTSFDDIVKKDKNNDPIWNSKEQRFEIDEEKTKELGNDLAKSIIMPKFLESTELNNDPEANTYLNDKALFDYYKPMLRSEEGLKALKEEIIPQKAKELANRTNNYDNLTEKEIEALSEENITKLTDKLIKKADEFKEIYDEIEDKHDFELNLKVNEQDNSTFEIFSGNLKNAKMSTKLGIDSTTRRINELEVENNSIENKVKKISTPISELTIGDVVDYNGDKVIVVEDDEYRKVSDLRGKGYKFKQLKEATLKVDKYDLDESQKNTYINNLDKINYNADILKQDKKDLKTLYNEKEQQKVFNDIVKNKKKYAELEEFNKTFTNNSNWTDSEGKNYKLKKVDDKLRLYEETIDENSNSQFVKEVEKANPYDNKKDFLKNYSKIEDVIEEPKETEILPQDVDEVKTDEYSKEIETGRYNHPEYGEGIISRNNNNDLVFIPDKNKKLKISVDITNKTNFIKVKIDITTKKKGIKINESKDFSDGDTSSNTPEQNEEAEYEIPTLAREYSNIYDATVGNLNEGRTDEYNNDPNMVKAQIISDKYNLKEEGLHLKVIKASTHFSKDKGYFDKEASKLGYNFNDSYYLVLVNEDGEYITEKDNKLVILEDQDILNQNKENEKDIIYWGLKLPTPTYKFINTEGELVVEDSYYTPKDLETYKYLFPEKEFKTKEKGKEYLLEQVEIATKRYSGIRTNIITQINKGNDVILPITGKSKGIENSTSEERRDAQYHNALTQIAEIEKTSTKELLKNSNIINAQEKVTIFPDGNELNTVKGAFYLHVNKSGRVYRLDSIKLVDRELTKEGKKEGKDKNNNVKNVIDLLTLYGENYNKYKNYEQARILRHIVNGEEKELIDTEGNVISVWRMLSNIFYMKDPTSDNFNKDIDIYLQGDNHLVVGGAYVGVEGSNAVKYKIINELEDGTSEINNDLIIALEIALEDKYRQINKTKLSNNETIYQPSKINPKTGLVEGKFINYKNFLLENVFQTKALIPKPIGTSKVDESFGGGTKQIIPPVRKNVYQKIDFSEYENNLSNENNTNEKDKKVIKEEKVTIKKSTTELDDVLNDDFINEDNIQVNIIESKKKKEENIDVSKLKDVEGLTFRKIKETFKSKEDIEKVKEWYNKNMPKELPLNIMQNLISQGLYGMMYKSAVYLDTNAEVGTGYHEAFHAISHLVIGKKQQENLYKEYRDSNPNTTLTDVEIEEVLAEEFRDYMLLKGKTDKISEPIKKSIFRKLYDWIKTILSAWSGNLTKDQVFDRISNGIYSNASIRPNSAFAARRPIDFETGNPRYDNPKFVSETIDSVNYAFFDYIRNTGKGINAFFNKKNNSDLIIAAYKNVLTNPNGTGIKDKFDDAYRVYIPLRNKYKEGTELTSEEILQKDRYLNRIKNYNTIINNINNGKVQKFHEIKLKDYGLERSLNEEALNEGLDEQNQSKDSGWDISDRSIKFSAKENASKYIKILLGTLPESIYNAKDKEEPYRRKLNSLELPYSAKFNETFAALISKLSGSKTTPDVIRIIKEYKKELPSLEYLWNSKGINLNAVDNNTKLPIERYNEIVQFVQTFGKTENNFTNDLVLENGERNFLDANLSIRRKSIKEQWNGNSITSTLNINNPYHKNYIEETNLYNSIAFTNVKLNTNKDTLNFLKSIGIEFTLDAKELHDKGEIVTIKQTAIKLLNDIKNPKINQVNVFSLEDETNHGQDVNRLIDIEYKTTIDNVENSHVGIEGETIYNHSLNYYISIVMDNINKFETQEELFRFYPHLNPKNTAYNTNSLLLNKDTKEDNFIGILYDKDGDKKINIDIKTVDGILQDNGGNPIPYSKLTQPERMANVIARVTNKDFNLLRPADATLEKFFHINHNLDISHRNKIFEGYLKDELLRYKEYLEDSNVWNNKDNNSKFRKDKNGNEIKPTGILIDIIQQYGSTALKNNLNTFFKTNGDIDAFVNNNSNSSTGDAHIEQALNDYFENRNKELLNWLISNKLVGEIIVNEELQFTNYGLLAKDSKGNHIQTFTQQGLETYLDSFIFQDSMMNIEQTKLFLGDPIFYKDVSTIFKRTKGMVGPKKMMISDEIMEDYIQSDLKGVDGAEGLTDDITEALLEKSNDANIDKKKPIVRQAIIGDVRVRERAAKELKEIAKINPDKYENIEEEGDGFSLTTLDESRRMNFRGGDWSFNENSMEDAWQWQQQKYYQEYSNLLPKGKFKELFGYEPTKNHAVINPRTGKEITKHPDLVWNQDKPMYFGPYAEKGFNPGYTKTAFGKLVPSMVNMKDSDGKLMFPNLKATMDWMVKNQIGVLSFASANKGATTKLNKDGSFNALYDNEGNLNLDNLVFENEINPETGEVTKEINAVIQNTYYEFWGIQVDTGNKPKKTVVTGTQQNAQVLNGLSSQGQLKSEFSHLKGRLDELLGLNEQRLDLGKEELLDKLEITQIDDEWTIKDFDKFKKSLQEIAESRGMSNNAIDAIDYTENSNLGMDILINKDKFEPAIYSLNNALVIKQKRAGAALFQMPSTLFERPRKDEEGNIVHSRKVVAVINGKPVFESSDLESYLPQEEGNTKRMGVYIADRYRGTSIEDLKGSKLLEAIGFRIPTQAPSSIEGIYIKGFLPKEVGDIIVLPSAIVAKAGSDYDIDKLNVYLSNYYYDENNNPIYIYHNNNIEADWAKYVDIQYNKMVLGITNKLKSNVDTIKGKFNQFKKELIKEDDLTIDGFIEKFENFNENLDTESLASVKEEVQYVLIHLKQVDEDTDYKYLSLNNYTKQAIENRIAEIHGDILLDKSNANNFLNVLDNDIIGELADKMYMKKTGKERNKHSLSKIIDRIFLVEMAERFLAAKDAVGITALASKFHIMSQLYDVQIKDTMLLPHNEKEGNISIGGLETSDGKESIVQLLSYWINAAVDGAKDPKMFDLNVNLETLNVVLYMTMAGVPTENIMNFINQPIIIEYINEQVINQSYIAENSKLNGTSLDDEIIRRSLNLGKSKKSNYKSSQDIQENLIKKYGKEGLQGTPELSGVTLGKYVGKSNITDKTFKRFQITVFEEYLKHKKSADLITEAIQGVAYDTNSTGKNSAEMLMRIFKTKKVLQNDKIVNYNKILEDSEIKGFMKPYYENIKDLQEQFEPLFKVSLGDPVLRSMVNHILEVYAIDGNFISKDELSKILDKLTNDYFTYQLVTKPYDLSIEVNNENKDKLIEDNKILLRDQVKRIFTNIKKDKELGILESTISVANQLSTMQGVIKDFNNTEYVNRDDVFKTKIQNKYKKSYNELRNFYNKYKDNKLVTGLIPILTSEKGKFNYVLKHKKKLDLAENNDLVLNWEILLNDENSNTANFGLNLIKLLILQNGIPNSPINFMQLVPIDIYSKLLASTMNNRNLVDEADMKEFFTQWIFNNFNDDKIISQKLIKGMPFQKKFKELKDKYKNNKELKEKHQKYGIQVRENIPPIVYSGNNDIKFNDLLPEDFIKDFKNGKLMQLYSLVENLHGSVVERLNKNLKDQNKDLFSNLHLNNIKNLNKVDYVKPIEKLQEPLSNAEFTALLKEYNIFDQEFVNAYDSLSDKGKIDAVWQVKNC